ncbi:MAG: prolyl oligopeptidase family serine peptidase [Massilia sp.]
MSDNRRACRLCLAALTLLAATSGPAFAQEPVFPPPAAMVLDNVPPVRASVAAELAKYGEFKPTLLAGWHPARREMLLLRRHSNTAQLFRIAKPGAPLELLTDYPDTVRAASYEPLKGKFYLFKKDIGGNEVFRYYRRDAGGGEAVAVTPDNQRVQDLAWSTTSGRIVYVSVPVNRQGSADKIASTVRIADPLKPEAARVLAELPGGGWGDCHFSPDDKQLVYTQYVSATESYLWLIDVASGKSRRITGKNAGKNGEETVTYGGPVFSRDGKGLYTVSDRGAEFNRLTYIDLASGKPTVLTPEINWDIESFALSDDGKLIAFVVNEEGSNVLRLMRTADHKLLPAPRLPLGVIGALEWHKDSRHVGLSLASATSPSEVYSVDATSSAVTRWTTHEATAVDAGKFVEPSLARWKSFDERMISGFVYRAPAAKFPGKRPVVINIHGGPESQFQPGFLKNSNYFMDQMGVTLIYPNVRGSSGYGKSFLKLDNGMLREDSVRDIGALLDWIATQPDMDASRVAVMGGSYGGYMTLAVSTTYADRIAASIDVVGISNFITFLERTESYRRELRRVEYGDEREPAMRQFMEKIAPVNNAAKIKQPLFVVHGKNDPRVPYQEADQIVATIKKSGTPVWYMTANDEGHGFIKKANADYQFFASIDFLKTYLLKP